MAKIKSANFDSETRKVQAAGGRPAQSDTHEFVAKQVLMIYVSFLKECAPKSWTSRRINHELFSAARPVESLTDKTSVANALGSLLKRKSIPLFTAGQAISTGILRTEAIPEFSGGLQILYHPYVRTLSFRLNLKEIHEVMALCDTSTDASLMRRTPHGLARSIGNTAEEIERVSRALKTHSEPGTWRSRFPDLFAVALSLAQEAAALGDKGRFRKWRQWFREGHLRFADWPAGDDAPRVALDRWVVLQLDHLDISTVDPFSTGFQYLTQHVIASEPAQSLPKELVAHERELPMTPPELAWTFLAIQGGRAPTRQEVARVLLPIGGASRNSIRDEDFIDTSCRWTD